MASPLKLISGIQPTLVPVSTNPYLQDLRTHVRTVSQEPGVYRWFSNKGELLYVGKAKNLRQRLRSYTTPTPRIEHFRKRALLEKMARLEVTYTSTEVEALILEMHLIRSMKPRYNIALTRERHYVYIRIGMNEDFPSVMISHKKVSDGALYLGPYTNPWMQRRMLTLLREIYLFRTCTMQIGIKPPELFAEPKQTIPLELTITKKDRRVPCLDYHIKQCSGPCTGEITKEEYQKTCIDPVVAFYRDDINQTVDLLLERMKQASGDRKFERASDIRDMLSYLGDMKFQKKLFDPSAPSLDAIGFDPCFKNAVMLQVRGGNVSNEETIELSFEDDPSTALSQIIPQLYVTEQDIPDRIVVPALPQDAEALRSWLHSKAGKPVKIFTPTRGDTLRLLKLAETNATRKKEHAAAR